MTFEPASIRTLQKLKCSAQADILGQYKDNSSDDEERNSEIDALYDVLDKNDRPGTGISSKYSLNANTMKGPPKDIKLQDEEIKQIDSATSMPRTPADVMLRSTMPKFPFTEDSRILAQSKELIKESDEKQDQEEIDEYNDLLNPRNFLNNIYQNDDFMALKLQNEKEIVEQTKQEMERKHIMEDMDKYLADLNKWKQKREVEKQERHKKQKEDELEKAEEFNRMMDKIYKSDDTKDVLARVSDPALIKVQQEYETSMNKFKNINDGSTFKNAALEQRDVSASIVNNLQNKAIQDHIHSKLQQKQNQISFIAEKLKSEKYDIDYQKQEQAKIEEEKKKLKQDESRMQNQLQQKKRMIDDFATFEDQLYEFDKDITAQLMEDKKKDEKQEASENFSQIDQMLKELQEKGNQMQKNEEQKKFEIQNMMKDIEDEFDEIDSILRDVESLKIADNPTTHEEHIEHSSDDENIKASINAQELLRKFESKNKKKQKINAPTD